MSVRPSLSPVWRRRVILMAAVAAVVAVPTALLIRAEGDDERTPEDPGLTEGLRDRGLGLRMALPDGWRQRKRRGVLRLRNRDRTVGMTISAPGPADDTGAVFATAREVIRSEYRRVSARRRYRTRLDGRPARVAVFTAIDAEHRTPLLIDVIVAEGRRRAYLVEIFTDARAGIRARVEGRALLRTLRLRR